MALTRIKPTSINILDPFSMANVAVQGNVDAGNVKTNNLLYANGVAWDLQQAAGASSQVQFNTNNNFDASANLTFNKSTQTLTTDTVVANITGNTAGTHTGPVVGSVTGTVLTASQPQITSLGTLTSLAVTNDATVGGNLYLTGNLSVSGTSTIINSTVLEIADSSLVLAKNATTSIQADGAGITINGAGANFTYNGTSNAFVSTHRISVDGGLVSNVNASNIATGTIPSSILGNSTHYIGTTGITLNRASGAQSLTGITSIDGYAPTVSSSAQPNITSVGTLTGANINGEVVLGNLATGGTRMRLVESGGSTYIQAGNGVNGSANVINFSPWFSGTPTMTVDLINRRIGVKKAAPTVELDVVGAGTFTGNVIAGNIDGGNLTKATYLEGTLTTALQPNITSVSTSFTGLTFAANGNITMSGTASQISGGNLVSASYISGNGSLLSALNASNISSGTIPSSILGNSTHYIGTTGITLNRASGTQALTGISSIDGYASTVSTAAQPNITSVGILTSVSVSGNANVANINANTNASFSGWLTSQQSTEILVASGALSSTSATYNLLTGASFYHSSVTSGANWTANFTNVPTTDGRSIVVTIIAVQGATPYVPSTIQIDGVTQTLKWSSGSAPSGTSNGIDVFSFALLRAGSAWVQILGSSSFFL